MSKRYITSSKPAGYKSENNSIVVIPQKYRAPIELPKETQGRKLYKKGGTLATRVIVRTIQ